MVICRCIVRVDLAPSALAPLFRSLRTALLTWLARDVSARYVQEGGSEPSAQTDIAVCIGVEIHTRTHTERDNESERTRERLREEDNVTLLNCRENSPGRILTYKEPAKVASDDLFSQCYGGYLN